MSEDDDPTLLVPSAGPATGGDADAPRRIVAGDRIGRHVVERRIGAGGMGVVFLARDPELDRPVAIKLLRPELNASRTRLLREGQAVAKLHHPNVVTVYDVGTLGDDLYMAMEYVPGRTLGSWLRRGQRPWREVLALFRDAGRGLAAAHRAGLVHRDFKPDNVLLGEDGRVVVTDFGLARSDEPSGRRASTDLDLTRTAGLIGTPAYMSPEQFREEKLDGRSDQFSFCVSLWQGLFGHRPFELDGGIENSTDVEKLYLAEVAGAIQEPANRRGVPARIVRALRRGLAAQPAARFATMEELLEALRPPDRKPIVYAALGVGTIGVLAFAASRGVETPAAGAPACGDAAAKPAAIWNTGTRAGYLAGADPKVAGEEAAWFDEIATRWSATAKAVCEAGAEAPPRAEACLDEALGALEHAIGREERGYWPVLRDPRACLDARPLATRELRSQLGSITPSGAIAPDGGAAFASDEFRAYFGANGATARAAMLAGVTRVHAWSADGKYLLARAGDATVRIDMTEGARTTLPWPADLLALTPDAGIAARLDGDGEAVVFTAAGGKELARVPVPDDVTAVAIEPGGRRAAIAANDEDGLWSLIAVDLGTGKHASSALRIHGNAGGTMAMTWAGSGVIAIGGSAVESDDEALWRVELDAAGAIAGPPVVLIPPSENTIMDLLDVRDRRALIVMVDVPVRLFRVTRGKREPVPGLIEGLLLSSENGRFLGVHDGRAAVFGADGSVVAEARDTGMPVLRDGQLWLAKADGGEVVLVPADPARPERRIAGTFPGELDRVRCGAAGQCWMSFRDEGELRHAVIDGDRLGPAFTVPIVERDMSLSPDGKGAAIIDHGKLQIFDIASGTLGPVLDRAKPDCDLDDPVWSPSGKTLFYSTDCEEPSEIYALRIAGGKPKKIETVSGHLTGVEPLGDDDVVYSVVDYQSRLVMVDDLPVATATSAE